MSERCLKCFRPISPIDRCLCKFVTPPIETGIKFVLLMHPKEAKRNRTGTGYLARAALSGAEILVGIDFAKNTRLQALLSDVRYAPMLLYPGENALSAKKISDKLSVAISVKKDNSNTKDNSLIDDSTHTKNQSRLPFDNSDSASACSIPLVIVIDATWFCSRKVLEHSPFLLELPRISFEGNYRSIFTFKREPRPECVSTIEACYYLIREFQDAGIVSAEVEPEPLMTAFKEMIRQQLQAENDRVAGLLPDTHAYNWKYKKTREIPNQLIN